MTTYLQEVEPQRRASVAIDEIEASRRQWKREHRRPRSLTAQEKLDAIEYETSLLWTAMGNMRNGVVLSDEDWARVTLARRSIDAIYSEASR